MADNGANPIFLVVGSPAVGKSTTSRSLAARFSKSVHIPVDDLREMVVSGLRLPGPEWTDEIGQQVQLGRESAVEMAFLYHAAGFTVVLDDFWHDNPQNDYRRLLAHPSTRKILLLPSQEIAHQRNLHRSGDSPARAYIDEGIRIVYQQMQAHIPKLVAEGWVVVDSSSLDLEQTVDAILQKTSTN